MPSKWRQEKLASDSKFSYRKDVLKISGKFKFFQLNIYFVEALEGSYLYTFEEMSSVFNCKMFTLCFSEFYGCKRITSNI